MKYNRILLFSLVAILAIGCKKKQSGPSIEAPTFDAPTITQETTEVNDEMETEPTAETEMQEVTEPESEIVEVEEEVVDVVTEKDVNISDHYFLIAASFVIQENAQRKVNEFREYGYKAKVVMRENDMKYRVALRSYQSRQVALDACENLKDNDPDLNDMWVLVSRDTEDREFN